MRTYAFSSQLSTSLGIDSSTLFELALDSADFPRPLCTPLGLQFDCDEVLTWLSRNNPELVKTAPAEKPRHARLRNNVHGDRN